MEQKLKSDPPQPSALRGTIRNTVPLLAGACLLAAVVIALLAWSGKPGDGYIGTSLSWHEYSLHAVGIPDSLRSSYFMYTMAPGMYLLVNTVPQQPPGQALPSPPKFSPYQVDLEGKLCRVLNPDTPPLDFMLRPLALSGGSVLNHTLSGPRIVTRSVLHELTLQDKAWVERDVTPKNMDAVLPFVMGRNCRYLMGGDGQLLVLEIQLSQPGTKIAARALQGKEELKEIAAYKDVLAVGSGFIDGSLCLSLIEPGGKAHLFSADGLRDLAGELAAIHAGLYKALQPGPRPAVHGMSDNYSFTEHYAVLDGQDVTIIGASGSPVPFTQNNNLFQPPGTLESLLMMTVPRARRDELIEYRLEARMLRLGRELPLDTTSPSAHPMPLDDRRIVIWDRNLMRCIVVTPETPVGGT